MSPLYGFENADPRAFDLLAWYNLAGAAGCFSWIVAYVFFILKGFRDRAPGLPLTAICLNFSWELLAAIVFPNPVPLWHFFDWAWMLIDLIIVYQLLCFGPSAQRMPEVKRYFHPLAAGVFLLGLYGQYAFVLSYRDRLGLVAAFMINLIMSITFVLMFLERRAHGRGISVVGAWAKMLGTLGTSIQCHYVVRYVDPEMPSLAFLTFLCVSIFVVDALYAALVTARALSLSSRASPREAALSTRLRGAPSA